MQRTAKITFDYTGPKGTLRIQLFRVASRFHGKVVPRKLVFTTNSAITSGGYEVVPRRFALPPGVYLADSQVFVGSQHSKLVVVTLRVGPSYNRTIV